MVLLQGYDAAAAGSKSNWRGGAHFKANFGSSEGRRIFENFIKILLGIVL